MSTLHVRNVPDELHERIQKLAETERCSLSSEVVMLLTRALDDRELRLNQGAILSEIKRKNR